MIQVNVDNTKADDIVNTLFGQKIKYNLREKVKKATKKNLNRVSISLLQ